MSFTRRSVFMGAVAAAVGYRSDSALAAAATQRHVELTIATEGDLLAYRPERLTCPTGARIHLTLRHTGKYISQTHNWVLTVPGAAESVAQAGIAAGERLGYVPEGDRRVLAATPQCDKGQQVSVDFTAPPPGSYPFLCTNPGHGAVMHGVLIVTPD
jgi:azurin